MRTMYDSVNPKKIPNGADIVASYVNGPYGHGYDQAVKLFPDALHLGISIDPHLPGQALDIEQGDARPEQAPDWVTAQRKRGVEPWCYMSLSVWDDVRRAMDRARVKHPHYWVAHWDGNRDIPTGAVACQYDHDLGHPKYNYDISAVVSSSIAGFDTEPVKHKHSPRPTHRYTVRKGDTLSSISQKFYGTDKYWQAIYHHNERVIGPDYNLIIPGQHLVIPHIGKASQSHNKTYVVKSGDTLSDIASHFYGNPNKWRSIYRRNRAVIGENPNKIMPGQRLVIP